MVQISALIGALALLSSVIALPRPDGHLEPANRYMPVGHETPGPVIVSDESEHKKQKERYEETVSAPHQSQTNEHKPERQTSTVVHTSSPVHTSSTVQHTSTPVHTSSTVQHTSSTVEHKPSPSPHVTTSTSTHVTVEPTSTSTHVTVAPSPAPTHSLPTYGSGSHNWENDEDFKDCVQKCVATFGSGPTAHKPTVTPTPTQGGGAGNGATHTVVVAPTQGVLRYMPFAINATVGDTVEFHWGANNHTVTSGSQLLPCNKTADANSFTSPVFVKGDKFSLRINNTEPVYMMCNVGEHCEKGMFGIINPVTNSSSTTSVRRSLAEEVSKNPKLRALDEYTRKVAASNSGALNWGSGIQMDGVPAELKESYLENVYFTRLMLAENPELLQEDGTVNMSSSDTVPLALPKDFAEVYAEASATSTPVTPPATVSPITPSTPSQSPPASAGALRNDDPFSGASSLASPKLFAAAVAILATAFLL